MKTIIDNNKYIIFLNNNETKKICYDDDTKLEDYFKKLFLKLSQKYDIELTGYYDVIIYKDSNYGAVIEFSNDDIDYYSYFNQVDVKIIMSKRDLFLYEINYNFIDDKILKKCECYKFLDKLYLKINSIDRENYFKLLELSNIIYGSKVDEILKYGKKVIL